ncbi:hypothetical protein [Clostridium sp. BL-8]|nr:hypothetical protein [Clostridium sp. BL-8]OOM77471.1 hypothetical protein CLOBL_29880 [Clostridium sp. BL-8]
MSELEKKSLNDSAKKMIIDGEHWDVIREKTHLRLKDLKRIQRDEINPKF